MSGPLPPGWTIEVGEDGGIEVVPPKVSEAQDAIIWRGAEILFERFLRGEAAWDDFPAEARLWIAYHFLTMRQALLAQAVPTKALRLAAKLTDVLLELSGEPDPDEAAIAAARREARKQLKERGIEVDPKNQAAVHRAARRANKKRPK